MIELRCDGNKLFGTLLEPSYGSLEVRCDSRWCGFRSGVVIVRHQFDLRTGEHTTHRFKPTLKGAR